MATPDPYWADQDGRRLPKKPCPKCGANVGPMKRAAASTEAVEGLVWRQVPDTVNRALSLGGERRGEEAARQRPNERPPVHHSMT